MALPVAHLLDRTGFRVIDFAGSSMFEVLVKYCRENPWEGLDLLRAAIRRTPMRGGMRANAAVSFGVTPDALMDTWMRRLNEHGLRSFWIYDCLFGWPKMARLARIAKEYGSEVAGTVFFSLSPVHTDAYFAERAAEMAAVPEIDTILFYDTGGRARRRADAHAGARAAGRGRRQAAGVPLEQPDGHLRAGLRRGRQARGHDPAHGQPSDGQRGVGAVHRERGAQPVADGPRALHRHPAARPGRRALPAVSARRPGTPSTRSASTTCSAPCTRSPAG